MTIKALCRVEIGKVLLVLRLIRKNFIDILTMIM